MFSFMCSVLWTSGCLFVPLSVLSILLRFTASDDPFGISNMSFRVVFVDLYFSSIFVVFVSSSMDFFYHPFPTSQIQGMNPFASCQLATSGSQNVYIVPVTAVKTTSSLPLP